MKKNAFTLKTNLIFALTLVMAVVLFYLINMVTIVLSNRYPLSADLTANRVYEIGSDTRALLDSLDKPVTINVLATEDQFGETPYLMQAKRIMDQYPRYSERVSLRYVDYTSDPTFAAEYPQLTLSEGDLLVTCGDKVNQLRVADMFNYTYNAAGAEVIESSRAEEAVTAAILDVISDSTVKIGVLSGNGTASLSSFESILRANGFDVNTVNLVTDELADYGLLILAAPQTDLSEDMLRKLETYLYNDGNYGRNVLYTASLEQTSLPNLEAWLSEWGVKIDAGAVFETEAYRTYQMQPYYPIALYEDVKYTDQLIDETTPFLMPLARPMDTLFEARDGIYVTRLLTFSSGAGVRPADADESWTVDQVEKNGPFPALVFSSNIVKNSDGDELSSNVIVSASTSMFESFAVENTSLTNGEYLVNLITDVTEREETIFIQPKSLAGRNLGITTSAITRLGVILGGVVPISILAAGMAIWLSRRYK